MKIVRRCGRHVRIDDNVYTFSTIQKAHKFFKKNTDSIFVKRERKFRARK